MSKRHGANIDNLEQTRTLFLDCAENEFLKYGYADASTTRIVDASGMARGSLYYHFKDKRDLYRAVYIRKLNDVSDALRQAALSNPAPDLSLLSVAKKYFEICSNPLDARILMAEPVAVLGADECQDISNQILRPILVESIGKIMDMGGFQGHNKAMIAMFLFSSLTESGRIIGTLPNRDKAGEQFFETFKWVLERLL